MKDCGTNDDNDYNYGDYNVAYATNPLSDYTGWLLSIGAISVIISLSSKKLSFLMIPGIAAAAIGAFGIISNPGGIASNKINLNM